MKTAVTFSISIILILITPFAAVAQETGQQHSFRFDRVPLRTCLDSLMKWYPESIVYLDSDLDGKPATGVCSQCTVDEALGVILKGSSLTWIRIGNQVIIKAEQPQELPSSAPVSGTITDSLTDERIAGATVMLQGSSDRLSGAIRRWCPTNEFGFFSFPRVSSGSYTLVVRALGYAMVTRTLDIVSGDAPECNIALMQKDIVMKEVTVEGRRTAMTSVGGISRGAYLRSVPSDRNQYMLDGGRIFNPSHFGGVLSTFSPEVLNGVQVVLGGLPPSYGGRVGGFVDLAMRDGTRDRLSGSLGMGSMASTFTVEGPVTSGTTFLFSGRRGYPDASMEILKKTGIPKRQNFSEVVGKVTHRLSGSGQISLSAYLGSDSYANQVEDIGEQLNNNFSWDNSMLELRWIGIVSPSLFVYVSTAYSHYDFDLQHVFPANSVVLSQTRYPSEYRIDDLTFNARAEGYYDEGHTLRAGVDLVQHRMDGSVSEFSTKTASFSLRDFSSWEATVYLQDQWKILPRLTAELGARATSFLGDSGTFSAVDPRFSLLASLDEQTLAYCSLSGVNQFIHPYRNSGVFLLYPTIFWYPSTESVRPSTSLLFSLGVRKNLRDDAYVLSAESYYRITSNLHEFGVDTSAMAVHAFNSSILFGKGKAYGFVCTFQKRLGDLTGSISYNLSWTLESFAEINGGRAFSSPFDRRHEVQLAAEYSVVEGWTLGVLCDLASGHDLSGPLSTVQGSRATGYDTQLTPLAAYGDFFDVNGSKLPGFQRLEFSAVGRFTVWNLPCQFSFRLLNGYGLVDPFVWRLRRSNDIRSTWNVALEGSDLLPLYPCVGLNVKF